MIKQFQFITSYQGWVSALRSQVSFYLDRKFSPFPAQVTALHHHPVAGASGKFVASSLALNAFNIASHTGQSEGRALLKQPIRRKVLCTLSHLLIITTPEWSMMREQREHRTQNWDNFISHHVLSPSHHPSTWRCQQNNKLPSKSWTLTPVKN